MDDQNQIWPPRPTAPEPRVEARKKWKSERLCELLAVPPFVFGVLNWWSMNRLFWLIPQHLHIVTETLFLLLTVLAFGLGVADRTTLSGKTAIALSTVAFLLGFGFF